MTKLQQESLWTESSGIPCYCRCLECRDRINKSDGKSGRHPLFTFALDFDDDAADELSLYATG